MDEIWGVPLLPISGGPTRRTTWRVKRLCDVVLSGMALLLLAPCLLACAAAVRWEAGPGVLFRQERVSQDGRRFTMLKFRTLKPAEERSPLRWSDSRDHRTGLVGSLLRATSLDELPQFWNVLRGDMSLVGPRPELPVFVDQFTSSVPRYSSRMRVPSGLTGWSQVHGLRGNTSIDDRAAFDNHYILNWSLWRDLKIMLRTGMQVVGRGGS
jgi:lipopolysaccharide/colanic/teichoic acid biosynthesis glycosyltransferase